MDGLRDTYSIVGIGETALGTAEPGSTAITVQTKAARLAMLDAGLKPSDIDGVISHWGEKATSMAVIEYLGLEPTYTDSTLVGGQSSLTHLVHAAAAIDAGLCSTVLITYGSTQKSDRSRVLGGIEEDEKSANSQFIKPYGMVSPIGFAAMLAQLHQHHYGSTAEDLGEIAIAARKWAQLNPNAVDQAPLDMETYLASRMICDPLRKLDICKVTDGAGAIIVTSKNRARDLPQKPVTLLGGAEKYTRYMTPVEPSDWMNNGIIPELAEKALGFAGLTRSDIDVVQIYDAFTSNVLFDLSQLGFCKPGEEGDFVRDGRIAPGGDFPLNTSGGGLSFNHPGMFGVHLVLEAVRQLRGDAGARQIPNAQTCMMWAGGFVFSANNVTVLGVD